MEQTLMLVFKTLPVRMLPCPGSAAGRSNRCGSGASDAGYHRPQHFCYQRRDLVEISAARIVSREVTELELVRQGEVITDGTRPMGPNSQFRLPGGGFPVPAGADGSQAG